MAGCCIGGGWLKRRLAKRLGDKRSSKGWKSNGIRLHRYVLFFNHIVHSVGSCICIRDSRLSSSSLGEMDRRRKGNGVEKWDAERHS